MKKKKGFKHYLRYYLIVLAVYIIYITVLALQNGGYDMDQVFGIIYIPFVFMFFVFVFDLFFDPIFNRINKKKNPKKDSYEAFLQIIDQEVSKQCDFTLEDFRRLRENDRFQKACAQGFKIVQDGETEELNMVLLEKKFKKNTREYEATLVVIELVKKMMVN